jgi:hypothetical protein
MLAVRIRMRSGLWLVDFTTAVIVAKIPLESSWGSEIPAQTFEKFSFAFFSGRILNF